MCGVSMSQEDIQNIYERTVIDHVSIPRKCYSKKGQHVEYSYQFLSSLLSMGNIEFFTLTVLLGKFVVKSRKEIDGGYDQFFKLTKNNARKDEMTILKAIAVDEVGNPFILKDEVEMRKIWVEYSYAGFNKLFEWYDDDNVDIYEKLSELMISNFKENLD